MISSAGMVKEINLQSGEMKAKAMAPELLERVNSGDDKEASVRDKTVTQQYRFQPKTGSVIPAKRKLVKTLMYESIVRSVATLLSCSRGGASSSSSTNPNISSKTVPPDNSANVRKDNNIFPYPAP